MEQENSNFANTGSDSFRVETPDTSKKEKSQVVLNIEEKKDDQALVDLKSKLYGQDPWYEKFNSYLINHSKIKIKDKADFFHMLSVMIDAGIPMLKALKSLATQSSNPRMQTVVAGLATDIEAGESLSKSMTSYNEIFTEQEIGIIQSGEASGQISRVLDSVSNDLAKSHDIVKKVKSALTYPIVVLVILFVVMIAMVIFIIPQLKDIFENGGMQLPLLTRVVIAVSDFMINQKIIMVLLTVMIVVGVSYFKRTEVGILFFDKLKLKIPVFGNLFRQAYLARFARSISSMLDSDISIVKTLEIVGKSVGNDVYKRRILLASEDIKQGISLAENLSNSDLFPPIMVNMVDVGEQTAQLDTIMDKVAKFYESELDVAVEGLSKAVEPLILVVIGGAVGVMVAAIMLPISQMTDLAGTL